MSHDPTRISATWAARRTRSTCTSASRPSNSTPRGRSRGPTRGPDQGTRQVGGTGAEFQRRRRDIFVATTREQFKLRAERHMPSQIVTPRHPYHRATCPWSRGPFSRIIPRPPHLTQFQQNPKHRRRGQNEQPAIKPKRHRQRHRPRTARRLQSFLL